MCFLFCPANFNRFQSFVFRIFRAHTANIAPPVREQTRITTLFHRTRAYGVRIRWCCCCCGRPWICMHNAQRSVLDGNTAEKLNIVCVGFLLSIPTSAALIFFGRHRSPLLLYVLCIHCCPFRAVAIKTNFCCFCIDILDICFVNFL